MKHIIRFSAISALILALMVSCSPAEVIHPTEAGIVSAATVTPEVTVDQTTNQVTFNIPKGTRGVIPVWKFQDKNGDWTTYCAQDGVKKIFTKSGDYTVRMHLMNASGVSPDYVECNFHIDNTIVNFDKYLTLIAGGLQDASKVWRIDNTLTGHLGCGPSGTTGTEWWSAGPDDKKDFGVYDNRLTFASEYTYTFDPGESGTVYVNIDVTDSRYTQYKGEATADYNAPAELTTTGFSFDVEGDDLFLTLPAGTSWPYIPNDSFITNPKLKVESITAKAMELVSDNGSIAWHYSLTSQAEEKAFDGYKYAAESNMWKPIDDASSFEITSMYYAHGSGWESYPEGSMTYVQNGPKWTVSLPYESDSQWQAQFHVQPSSLSLSASVNYDFSCIINSSTGFNGVTIKLTDSGDDGNFLFAQTVEVKAYEDYVFYLTDLPGVDAASTKLVFDFGGCRENTEMVIRNIVLKDHSIDDGTVLPEEPEEPEEEEAFYDVDNPETNFWLNSTTDFTYWYSASDWSGALAPVYEWTDGDQKNFKLTIPEGIGGSEWQGQTHFTINHPVEGSKLYDFCTTINADADFTCTVKLAWEGNDNDNSFFYTNQFEITAFADCTLEMPNIFPSDKDGNPIDYDKVALIFDFGRTPAGTEIDIKDVCLQEHQDPKTEPEGTDIWDNSKVTVTWWYSASDWSGALTPDISTVAGGWSVIIPEGIGGSEWQGQTHFTLDAGASAQKTYDFKICLNSSTDCTCTVKLAWEGNDNDHAFFYDGNVQLTAYEDTEYVQLSVTPDTDYDKIALFVDLGRTAAGSEVTITDIHLYEK